MKIFNSLILIIIILIFTGCSKNNNLGEFVSAESPIQVPDELIKNKKFKYGYIKVPEFHDDLNGKIIELAVAIIKCKEDSATREPLVLVTGGPGESDIDEFVPLFFGDLGTMFRDNRDIVVIELRGLKYSKPNLITPEIDKLQMHLLDKNLTVDETISLYMDTLKVVYERFENEGINLSAYNDYEIANDIVFVMEKFGYKKFSIFGSSFGTLVAQHLLLNHQEHLVSATLNAVVDINNGLTMMHVNSIKTFEKIFNMCEKDPKLNKAYPKLKSRFLSLLKKLDKEPEILEIKNPIDGKTHKVVLNGVKLASWIFGQMYWNSQIPLTLHKILSGDYSQIINEPAIIFPLKDFSIGLSLSILLSEYSNFDQENIPINNEYINFVKGSGTMIFTPHFLNKAKNIWKVSDLQNKNIIIESNVPTLLYSGELDHVCPPEYAKNLSSQLNNSYLHVFTGIAHSPIDFGYCGIMMMKEFIDNPTKAPDNSCMEEFKSGFLLPEI